MTLEPVLNYLIEQNLKFYADKGLTVYKIYVDEKDDTLKLFVNFLDTNNIRYYLSHEPNNLYKGLQFILPKKANLDNYILNKPFEEVALFLEETRVNFLKRRSGLCDHEPGRVTLTVENNLVVSYGIEQ